jgi:ELWxxDGT repeat protein
VAEIRPGAQGSSPELLTAANGLLFFRADDGESGIELWRSNGTPVGTLRLADIAPGPDSSFPSELRQVGGKLLFQACSPDGCEVWTSDGTVPGTFRLADVEPGLLSSNPRSFTASGSQLFFSAHGVATGHELWSIPLSALPDPDADGLFDVTEASLGTDPDQADSDGDALSDGAEVNQHGTDPLDPDSDDDGFPDGAEIAAGFDPLDPLSHPPVAAAPTLSAWGSALLASLLAAIGSARLRAGGRRSPV